jgi:hypothetical protein
VSADEWTDFAWVPWEDEQPFEAAGLLARDGSGVSRINAGSRR